MRIIIIGTGNVATVLGKKILEAEHEILQVYGRNKASAQMLAEILRATHTDSTHELLREGDLYIIAVADSAVQEVATRMQLKNKLVVHTAGSVPKEVLKPASKNYGVLYPLQSLRKEMLSLPDIPFLVDGNTSDDLTLLYDFAKTLSGKVQVADNNQRLHMHLAAVIVSNFNNHLFTLAEAYCQKEKVDFKLLLPLIQEVSNRLSFDSPKNLQTGPAIRNDKTTIENHLSLLENYPEIKNLYTYFSKSIQELYGYASGAILLWFSFFLFSCHLDIFHVKY